MSWTEQNLTRMRRNMMRHPSLSSFWIIYLLIYFLVSNNKSIKRKNGLVDFSLYISHTHTHFSIFWYILFSLIWLDYIYCGWGLRVQKKFPYTKTNLLLFVFSLAQFSFPITLFQHMLLVLPSFLNNRKQRFCFLNTLIYFDWLGNYSQISVIFVVWLVGD